MKQEELDELDRFRRMMRLAADAASSPYVAREMAKAADNLGKVSGPSKARQRAIAVRDAAFRRLRRQQFADLSTRRAADMIAGPARRYGTERLKFDLEALRRPVDGIERAIFDAAVAGIGKIPSARALERILAE